MFAVFGIYFWVRFIDPRNFLPEIITEDEISFDKESWKITLIGIFNILLMFQACVKCISFLQVYDAFFQLLAVANHCFINIIPFTFMLYSWIIMMSFIFRILGVDKGDEGG